MSIVAHVNTVEHKQTQPLERARTSGEAEGHDAAAAFLAPDVMVAEVAPRAGDEHGATTPPSSNTGALNTSTRIDWLEFTCSWLQFGTLYEWCNQFGLEEVDHGAMGYDSSATFAGSGRLYWCSDVERSKTQGVHVALPSSCLDNLLAFDYDITRILLDLSVFDATVTRLDIAYDDRPGVGCVGLLDLSTIIAAIKADEYVSRSRSVTLIQKLKGGEGTTIYFGSGQSDSLLRIYDKSAEQRLKTREHWIRVEIQLRRERAHALFLMLCGADRIEDFDFGAILFALLDFKVPDDSDTNKSRWLTTQWWSDFVQSTSKIHLSKSRVVEESIEHSMRWLRIQVAPTLAFLTSVYQGDTDYLTGLMIEGLRRISKTKRAIIKTALESEVINDG